MRGDSSIDVGGAGTWRGSGLILVIDDEAGIVRLASRLLTALGFEVRSATDGTSGLQLFRESGSHARLILLDRTMPGLSGDHLLRQIHQSRPDLPIIVSSGMLAPAEQERLREAGARGFVVKPYRQAELIGAIRQALAEGYGHQ